jgi:hypothetical protein
VRFAEVLGDGRQCEFVAGAARPSQADAIQTKNALELCKQHLDLLPLSPRGGIGLGLRYVASHVATPALTLYRGHRLRQWDQLRQLSPIASRPRARSTYLPARLAPLAANDDRRSVIAIIRSGTFGETVQHEAQDRQEAAGLGSGRRVLERSIIRPQCCGYS